MPRGSMVFVFLGQSFRQAALVGLSPTHLKVLNAPRTSIVQSAPAQRTRTRWTQRFGIEPSIVRTRSAVNASPLRSLRHSKKWTKSHVASLTASAARVVNLTTTRRRHHLTAPGAGPGAHRRPFDGNIHSCSVQSVVIEKILISPTHAE